MENDRKTLLPQILELLSNEDNLTCTVDELSCKIKEDILKQAISPFRSFTKAVVFALEEGEELGILSIAEQPLCMTNTNVYNLHENQKKSKPHHQIRRVRKPGQPKNKSKLTAAKRRSTTANRRSVTAKSKRRETKSK